MPPQDNGLVIVPEYDSSITGLSPTLYTEVTGAITAAIDFYEAKITNSMTITIDFGYGEVAGETLPSNAVSESLPLGLNVTYSTLRNALVAHGDTNVPVSDPSGGSGSDWFVSYSELNALGLSVDEPVDGYVGLGSGVSFTYDPNDRAVPGDYDAIGALEHEISEVMGRVAYYSADNYTPLDLFRYTQAGTLASSGGAAYFSIDGGQTNLAAFNNNTANGGDAGDWASSVPDDSYDAFSSTGVANTVSSTDLTVMKQLGYSLATACYVAGTSILTARGEVRVEDLAVGDVVHARFAGLAPIRWIGHRRIDCRRHPDPQLVWPVRIVAGAFGPDQPCRDLWLSPDHAVAVDDALIPIRLLVNGATIRQETGLPQVHYFHLELDRHDLLLADGLAAESFLDTGNRGMFANAEAPIVLHPRPGDHEAQGYREAMSCLPLCGDPVRVESVWHSLAVRAESIGLTLPTVATTHDPALCIVVGTRRFVPVAHNGGRYTFVLPALPGGARLQSRCVMPSALRPWLEDRRRLGVMVHRITLRCGADLVDVALDDPRLTDGWWAVERDDATLWRWTDGDAALPSTDGLAIVEVVVGNTLAYPLAEPARAGQMAGGPLVARAPDAASPARKWAVA